MGKTTEVSNVAAKTEAHGRSRTGRPTDEDLTGRILNAGVEQLQERGYAALSVERVALQAGCGKAAIYRRYPGKPDLVAAVIESKSKLWEIPDTGSLRDDLLVHVQQNQINQDGLGFTKGRGMQAIFEPEVYPILWQRIFRIRHERGRVLLDRGVARGELSAAADQDVMLDTLAGLTLYRQTVKGIRVDNSHYLSVIDALIAHPPLRIA